MLSGSVGTIPAAAAAEPRGRQDTWSAAQAGVTPAAQAAGRDGFGITVAVLDTWIDASHPDFEGRALVGADCVGGVCRAGQTPDACDHGTHVAGTVASTSYGVAPRATILPVRVLAPDPRTGACLGRPQDVAAGIGYALEHEARVINLSLGEGSTDDDGILAEAVRKAATAGVLVVLAAGNGDDEGGVDPESSGPGALVVAATDRDGRLASYSPNGDAVDLAAPGGDATDGRCGASTCVTSLFPGGGYALAAGTSMAAPMVSGVAALLLAQQPGRTGQDVADMLTGTTRPLTDAESAGAGLLDASAALGLTAPSPRPAGTPSSATVRPLAADPPTSGSSPTEALPATGSRRQGVPVALGAAAVLLVVATAIATVFAARSAAPRRSARR